MTLNSNQTNAREIAWMWGRYFVHLMIGLMAHAILQTNIRHKEVKDIALMIRMVREVRLTGLNMYSVQMKIIVAVSLLIYLMNIRKLQLEKLTLI